MKKIVLIVGLVILVVGALVGGMAWGASALTAPTLKVTGNPGSAPGTFTFAGQNWTYPGPVALYMDTVDASHQVANAKVASNGVFISSVMIGSATLGVHNMIAVQGLNNVSVPFTITSKPPTDPVLSGIQDDVTDLKSRLANTPVMETVSGNFDEYGGAFWPNIVEGWNYAQARHVTVILYYENVVAPWQGVGIFAEIGGKLISITEARTADMTPPLPPESGILKADFTTTHWQIIDEEENWHTHVLGYYSATVEWVPQ